MPERLLDSKKFLIEGRHDEKHDVQGILELQKANLSDSLPPEKKDTINEVNIILKNYGKINITI